MHIRFRDLDAVGRLWRELSEFPAAECDAALRHCLEQLARIVGASNAAWVAASRIEDAAPQDALCGWGPADLVVLHDSEAYARKADEALQQFRTEVVDPQSAAMLDQTGTTRVLLRANVVDDDAWQQSWMMQNFLGPLGMADRLVGSFPVSACAESYFALDRAKGDRSFDFRSYNVLRLFIAGCPLFHEEQLRARGVLDASGFLSPRERDVLGLLLTDLSEHDIAETLGLSYHTAHQYVVAVYRRFGVHSRAALASKWLRHRPPGDPLIR